MNKKTNINLNTNARKVSLTMPEWMLEKLDEKASSLAVSRNALINMWLDERLGSTNKTPISEEV